MSRDHSVARLAQQITFIAECDKLKEIFRQTINITSRRPENDAETGFIELGLVYLTIFKGFL